MYVKYFLLNKFPLFSILYSNQWHYAKMPLQSSLTKILHVASPQRTTTSIPWSRPHPNNLPTQFTETPRLTTHDPPLASYEFPHSDLTRWFSTVRCNSGAPSRPSIYAKIEISKPERRGRNTTYRVLFFCFHPSFLLFFTIFIFLENIYAKTLTPLCFCIHSFYCYFCVSIWIGQYRNPVRIFFATSGGVNLELGGYCLFWWNLTSWRF